MLRSAPLGEPRMITLYDPTETISTSTTLSPVRTARRRRVAGVSAALLASLSALVACGGPSPARAPEPPAAPAEPEKSAWPSEPAPPESVVHAEFQTSAQAVEPRGKFLLAVHFAIEPGYRISWQNPGDVGQSTRVRFEVPEGFSVGPLQFPAPERFQLPGKLVNYGYENDTAIFAEVTAPERLPEGRTYRFDVKADWLACKDDCATEELSAWFELVSARRAPAAELSEELSAHYAAIPQAFDALPKSDLDWKGGSSHPALTLKAAKVKWLDFFPGDREQPKLIRMKPAGEDLRLEFAAASDKPLRGLAVAEVEGKRSFFDVNVPWPSE